MALWREIYVVCLEKVRELHDQSAQYKLNGTRNLWIVKPGAASRGRDIQVFAQLQKIIDYTQISTILPHTTDHPQTTSPRKRHSLAADEKP